MKRKANDYYQVSAETAFSYLEKAQECLALLDKIKLTLKLPKEVELTLGQYDQYSKDKFALEFSVNTDVRVCRLLTFTPGDVLADDLYAMTLVRFQEQTGGDWTKLPAQRTVR